MKKKLLCIALAFVFTVGLGLTAQAEDLALPAPSCILMEKDTGQILYESNAHEKLRPASVTKIMTLLLVMEALDNGSIGWDDTVTTSAAAAAKGGSQIYLEENEQLPLREMLKSVVVSSANDCGLRTGRARGGQRGRLRFAHERPRSRAWHDGHAFCQLHRAGRWAGRGHASDDGL